MTKTKILWEFKKNLGEDLQEVEKILWSEKLNEQYKKALFKEIIADPEYQQLKNEYLNEKRSEKEKEKLLKEAFSRAQKFNSSLIEEDFKVLLMWKSETKETKESPRKALEKERKTAAIAELNRLGMKTEENVKKINAIQFLDDNILIGNTPWAYENMIWGVWTFKKETNRYYYNLAERKAEAKNQGITLPEKKDFENTLKALPGEYSEISWYKGWNILSIILWETITGYCDSDGTLLHLGMYGYLGSISEYSGGFSRNLLFDGSKGLLNWYYNYNKFVCRPLVKNS